MRLAAPDGTRGIGYPILDRPKGLPKDVTDKLVAALQAALNDEKVIARFADLGTEPVAQEKATPDALKKQLASEVAKWGPVIKAAGVKGN
jgi:putative tricarboxylic transport membrane protein